MFLVATNLISMYFFNTANQIEVLWTHDVLYPRIVHGFDSLCTFCLACLFFLVYAMIGMTIHVSYIFLQWSLYLSLWSLFCSFLYFRLLALATCFATKMIRKYWLVEHKKDAYEYDRTQMLSLLPVLPEKVQDEVENSRRLREMAQFLEIIRNLQSRLGSKYKRPGRELVSHLFPLQIFSWNHICFSIYVG